ncbi:hypothetical protein [Brevundimonas sp.]|uniref:hypothetical protein n=1 Tax=Brevundimonas sp. TaxID=1871086 RepID=UPI0035AF989A
MDLIATPLGLALLAASVSFLSLVISKESKISEFRQDWIDTLRQEISELISLLWEIHYKATSDEPELQSYQNLIPAGIRFSQLSAKIRLLLNSKEIDSQRINSAIDSLPGMDAKNVAKILDRDAVMESATELIALTNKVLKSEWKRVKRGEAFYFATKWCLVVSLVVTLALIISTSF